MANAEMVERLNRLQAGSPTDHRLEVTVDGDRIIVATGRHYVERRRRSAMVAAIAFAVVAGVAGIAAHGVWILGAVGVVGAIVFRTLARSKSIFEINVLTVEILDPVGARIAGQGLSAVRGRYETQGWDPRSVIYGELPDGADVPIIVFAGTDERLAEQACRLLGTLLNVPSTYQGTEGRTVSCYEPAAG